MSMFIQVGPKGGPTQIASNTGYAAFRDWAESLDYPELEHLARFSWSQELDLLEEQLSKAIQDGSPTAPVADTANEILQSLKERSDIATVCTITDGLGD